MTDTELDTQLARGQYYGHEHLVYLYKPRARKWRLSPELQALMGCTVTVRGWVLNWIRISDTRDPEDIFRPVWAAKIAESETLIPPEDLIKL